MNIKSTISILIFSLFTILLTLGASNFIFAQPSNVNNDVNTTGLESATLLEKIKGASSLSNIQTISWVDGIQVSGFSIGENQATVTLTHVRGEDSSIPVTVMVIKTPGSSVKSLLALMEASNKLTGKNATNPLVGIIGQLGAQNPGAGAGGPNMSSMAGLAGLNVSESIMPLQALLQLGKDTKIGVANIVGGNWEEPRTITTGISTLGGLLGLEGGLSSEPRVNLAMVLVVPYSGKTSFGTVEFK
jgi:hypothetical protein